MDRLDRQLINHLQDGFPLDARPFFKVAEELNQAGFEPGVEVTEQQVMDRVQTLLDEGYLSRFGPMFQAERMGGGLTLAAMKVAPETAEIGKCKHGLAGCARWPVSPKKIKIRCFTALTGSTG